MNDEALFHSSCQESAAKRLALIVTALVILGTAAADAPGPSTELGNSSDNRVFEGAEPPFKYPPTPWLWDMSHQYFWFGLPIPRVTAADDWVPDPNIEYLGGSVLTILRFTSSFLGPFDLLIVSSFVQVKNGAPVSRIMQEYSSINIPKGYPLNNPIRSARFDWKQQSSGGMDLRVFSPPNATTPVAELTGIYSLPLDLTIPLANTTALGPLIQEFFSSVQTVKNPETVSITSTYVKNYFSYSTQGTLVVFRTLSSPNGELSPFFRNVVPIGSDFSGGLFGVRVDPYIPST
eukprot:jgi/Botrbrau1/10187/Bobra.116_1s0004.1